MNFGGFSETRPATPEIQKIADKVKPQLEEKTNESYQEFKAVSYRSQVVAGTNYYIKVKVGENRYVHIEVLEPFTGRRETTLKLTRYETNKSKDDELSFS